MKTEADPLLLLLLPAHPARWLLAYLWTGCCCSPVEGWVNKAAACRWDCLRWMALSRIHTRTPWNPHMLTLCQWMAEGRGKTRTCTWTNSLGKSLQAKNVFFVFNGQQGHRGGAAGVFDSAFAEVKLGQKLGANLLWLTVSVCARGRKATN